MPLRTDFGAFRQPVDPTRGISDVLSNLQGQVSNYEKRKDLLAQQAIENQRQEELLNLRKSQEEREARKFGRTLTGEEAAQKASGILSAQSQNVVPEQVGQKIGELFSAGKITSDQAQTLVDEASRQYNLSPQAQLSHLSSVALPTGDFDQAYTGNVLAKAITPVQTALAAQRKTEAEKEAATVKARRDFNKAIQTAGIDFYDTKTGRYGKVSKNEFEQMKAQEPTRYEYGKPLKKSGDGKTDGKGKGLYSENKEFRDKLDKVARGYFTGSASDDIAKSNLAHDFDALQELTGMSVDETDAYFNDLVSEKGYGLGQGYLDQKKVNNIFRDRTVKVGNTMKPIGEAIEILRIEDTDGNKKYAIAKDEKGKPYLDINPLYNDKKQAPLKSYSQGPSGLSVLGRSVFGNAYPLISGTVNELNK